LFSRLQESWKICTNISWSDEIFVVSMRDARGYFIRHIFKKNMWFNWLKNVNSLWRIYSKNLVSGGGGLNYNMKTAKIQERFFFEDEMVDFNNFLHPSITFIYSKTTRQPLATCTRNVLTFWAIMAKKIC
jgi:hypothetical protein